MASYLAPGLFVTSICHLLKAFIYLAFFFWVTKGTNIFKF